jgi:CRP-like cAMP-binding protein
MALSLLEPNRRNLPFAPHLFDRRSTLPLQPQQLWQIESGAVRSLIWTEEGVLITLGLWGVGDVVGKVLSRSATYQVECLTEVKATVLPKERWYQVTEALIRHTQQTQELLEIVRCGQAEESLLRLLTWLAQRFGRETQQGRQIDLRLTHQELAELTGLTRVTVTRLLSSFEKRGLIQRNQKQIVVLPECEPFWHYEI